jgi:hypothetical protein
MGSSQRFRVLLGVALLAASMLTGLGAIAPANAVPNCGDIRPHVRNIVNSNIRCPDARDVAKAWLVSATAGPGPTRTYARANGFRCHLRAGGDVRCRDRATGGRAGTRMVLFHYSR